MRYCRQYFNVTSHKRVFIVTATHSLQLTMHCAVQCGALDTITIMHTTVTRPKILSMLSRIYVQPLCITLAVFTLLVDLPSFRMADRFETRCLAVTMLRQLMAQSNSRMFGFSISCIFFFLQFLYNL